MGSRAEAIAQRLEAVRTRTLELYEPLDPVDLHRAPDPIMSPPVWDLGHIAAYEELWLVCRLGGGESLQADLQAAYDAYETPRAERGRIRLLDAGECRTYLREVRARTLDVLASVDLDPAGPELVADGFVFEMVAQHEAQHTETILQALQMFPDGVYRPPARRAVPEATPGAGGRVVVPGGAFAMGTDASLVYDNESPRHERALTEFLIDRHPVSNARHLAFMADDGYERRELWSEEGWTWRTESGVRAPMYWEPDAGGGWLVRSFAHTAPVDPERPVCHVSWFEADAHARWAGARLPSEVEWERAARGHGRGCFPWGDSWEPRRANLDQLAFTSAPVGAYEDGASPAGCVQMIGDVWEWTADAFQGYPGFRAFPYREYSETFFGDRYRVLRGGSWATQPVAARTTFRNWDLPERRQIFAGFRLAWDAE